MRSMHRFTIFDLTLTGIHILSLYHVLSSTDKRERDSHESKLSVLPCVPILINSLSYEEGMGKIKKRRQKHSIVPKKYA